jgi:hypothetical protein
MEQALLYHARSLTVAVDRRREGGSSAQSMMAEYTRLRS